MARLTVDISRATAASAAEISQLLEANSIAKGGELYGDWSEPVVERWLNDGMPVFVARIDNAIKGVLLTSEPHYLKSAPAVRMLEHVEQERTFYVYGPVCIARDVRGAGLLAKLWEASTSFHGERRAVLFINQNNPASLAAHARLGMAQLAAFQAGGRNYFVFGS
ncbi:GNAT family N-acetyltransferase [Bradyrhizobium sp. CIR3A]|uniref:GNAT family N-acetyltransferase n=1 Tax=Bradyrhizobium sp. CIR3A TaxID=2663838 RepID=UPI0016064D2A|nr:N-acetyltransferase [Bradyrhizobium sp. CIR3A]MBB4261383.1 putative GNAT superfamily acetyltransferase [Bradyrhizobium sp. CIR3A]